MNKRVFKFLALVLSFLLLAVLPPAIVSGAEIVESGACGRGVTYTLTADGLLTVSGTGAIRDYSAEPSTDTSPFYKKDAITGLVIEPGVTAVGSHAFDGCSMLASVDLPEGLTRIGSYAFNACKSLVSAEIPEGVEAIERYAFYGCKALQTVGFNPGLTSIGVSAFESCSMLGFIDLPETLTEIGGSAFCYCVRLASIVVPESVTYIGGGAFGDTKWLDDQDDGLVYIGPVAYKYKGVMPENTAVLLADGTKTVSGHAFENCKGMVSVDLGESLETIGIAAFNGCEGLTSVTIPHSVKVIEDSAFSHCTSLFTVGVGNGLTEVGALAFNDTAWLNAAPDGLIYLGKVAYICKGTVPHGASIAVADGTQGVADYAFSGAAGFKGIDLPEGITCIGDHAFYNCRGVSALDLPESLTDIKSYAFAGCTGLTETAVPAGVASIGKSAYEGCTGLKNVDIPEGVSEIGSYAFYGCTGLTSVDLPESLTDIGAAAFYGCTGIKSVVLPANVQTIGDGAFINLPEISVGSLIETAPEYLQRMYINAMSVVGGCSVDLKTLKVQSGVSVLPADCCKGFTRLSSVYIPATVTRIESGAFENCAALADVYYEGDSSAWKQIAIDPNNTALTGAAAHYDEHDWDEGVVTKAPTCTEDGEKTYTCRLWGVTKTEPVPATGHDWGDWKPLDGEQHKSVCRNDASHVDIAPHVWDEGAVTRQPTPDKPGEMTFTCTLCGYAEKEAVAWQPGGTPDKPAPGTDPADVKMGDPDGDGAITAADARFALRAAVDLEDMTDAQRMCTDADGDGHITAADARLILRAAVGLEEL